MFFSKEEKVFSLTQTSAGTPPVVIKDLFEEFFCYLLVAGLYREGESVEGVHVSVLPISDRNFQIPAGSYNQAIANQITKGLKERFHALLRHHQLAERERDLLNLMNRLFVPDKHWTLALSGNDLFGIALYREFSAPMQTIARYVAMMYGRTYYPEAAQVPQLYLSAFGNIHLSADATVWLESPALPYGSRYEGMTEVSALWSLMSAHVSQINQVGNLSIPADPYTLMGDLLIRWSFMSDPCEFEGSIPAPVYATSLYIQHLMGVEGYQRVSVAAAFYQSFLYGACDKRRVSRYALLNAVFDLMVKRTGISRFDLYNPSSPYRKLIISQAGKPVAPKRPELLKFALEALDQASDDDELVSTDDVDPDPQTEDGGFDPANPTPITTQTAGNTGENNIGLISFDKSGEGVDEELYRSAVVALNDRLRKDNTLPVTAETREALDYWVNGFLYRTAISSTKDYMVVLDLQRYLKKF